MTDFVLQGELALDEEALESVEQKQLEVSGEPDSVQEAKEANEEQNETLGFIGRTVFSLVRTLGAILAILTGILATANSLADTFDISFEDVRTAIVNALNNIVEAIDDLLPGGEPNAGRPETPAQIAGFAAAPPGLGPLVSEAIDNRQEESGDTSRSGQGRLGDQDIPTSDRFSGENAEPLPVFTSRNQIIGDSTLQEKRSNSQQTIISESGSGGNQQ